MELKIPDPFLQYHLEEYSRELNKRDSDLNTPMSVYRRYVAETAVELGWVEEPDKDWKHVEPWKVKEVFDAVQAKVQEAQAIPKK